MVSADWEPARALSATLAGAGAAGTARRTAIAAAKKYTPLLESLSEEATWTEDAAHDSWFTSKADARFDSLRAPNSLVGAIEAEAAAEAAAAEATALAPKAAALRAPAASKAPAPLPAALQKKLSDIVAQLCRLRPADWERIVAQLEQLEGAISAGAVTAHGATPFVKAIPAMADGLKAHIGASRSQVAKAACKAVGHLAAALGGAFAPAADALLEPILQAQGTGAGGGNDFMRGYARDALLSIARCCPSAKLLATLLKAAVAAGKARNGGIQQGCLLAAAEMLQRAAAQPKGRLAEACAAAGAKSQKGATAAATTAAQQLRAAMVAGFGGAIQDEKARAAATEAFCALHAAFPATAHAVRAAVKDADATKRLAAAIV